MFKFIGFVVILLQTGISLHALFLGNLCDVLTVLLDGAGLLVCIHMQMVVRGCETVYVWYVVMLFHIGIHVLVWVTLVTVLFPGVHQCPLF